MPTIANVVGIEEEQILPVQLLPLLSESWQKNTIKKLYYNNLCDVIDILDGNCSLFLSEKNKKKGPVRDKAEAEIINETIAWVLDDNPSPHCLSFLNTCAALHLDPDVLRQFLLNRNIGGKKRIPYKEYKNNPQAMQNTQ